MKFKPRKSKSVTLKNGRQVHYKYKIADAFMPAIHQKPVKSLGRMYEGNLSDRSRGMKLHREVEDDLLKINKTNLPGKYKLWILQFALYPRLEWPHTKLASAELRRLSNVAMFSSVNGCSFLKFKYEKACTRTTVYCNYQQHQL